MGLRKFYGKEPHTLLRVGWRAALLQLTAYITV